MPPLSHAYALVGHCSEGEVLLGAVEEGSQALAP